MKGLVMLLKSFGVNLTSEQATQLSEFLPRIPGEAQKLVEMNAAWIRNFDTRLKSIEQTQGKIMLSCDLLCRAEAERIEKESEEENGRSSNRSGSSNTAGAGTGEGNRRFGEGNGR